jgi:Peptidase family M28
MRSWIFLVLLLAARTGVSLAQSPAIVQLAGEASTQRLKTNLYFLASDQLEGRLMASHGDTLASQLVADGFRQAHLLAPYDKGANYFQAMTAIRSDVVKDVFSIDGKSYGRWDGWVFQGQLADVPESPLVFAGGNTLDSFFLALPKQDVGGKAIIVPFSVILGAQQAHKMDSLRSVLSRAGGRMIIYKYPGFDVAAAAFKAHDFLPHYVDSVTNNMDAGIPVFALSEQRFNELTPAGTVSARISKKYVTVAAPNVIGILPGSDPKAPCVILSAHHDHNGRNGSTIYYGAVDNASGTVALLEMARLMDLAVKKGFRPKRTIVFASYTGEEEGLLGSAYFSKHPVYPVNDTYAVLNIDMLGRVDTFYSGRRPDSNYVYILVKDSLDRGLRQAVYKANESSVHLILDTHYEDPQFAQRRIRGSDQYPFYLKGVPFVRIDCGFTKDYHQPTDTPDKVDYDLLTRQTKLVFLTLWNMANN